MLKLTTVKYGFFPYGASNGMRSFVISFIDEALSEGSDAPDVESFAKETLEKIFAEATALGQSAEMELALIAQVHLVFDGDALAKKDNIPYSNKLLEVLSKVSLDRQKNNVAVHKLRPPYLLWHGRPLQFTMPFNWYENFQTLLVELPIDKGLKPETMLTYFKVNPLIECANHSISCFIFHISCAEDVDRMNEFYLSEGHPAVDSQRIFAVPTSLDPTVVQIAIDAAKKYKLRFCLDASLIGNSDVVSPAV